jgi:hypothetical protein
VHHVLTKTCSKCRFVQTPGDFYVSRARPDGLESICKSCAKAKRRAQYAADPEVPAQLTPAQLGEWINTRAAYSETTDDWHWAFTGPRTGKGRRALLVVAAALGSPVPDGSVTWCSGELDLVCCNPDHVIGRGSLPQTTWADITTYDDSGSAELDGFQVHESLSHLQKLPRDPADARADKWMRKQGYGRSGEPLKRRPL